MQTEVKTDRLLGTRIKHRMTRNWLKMYDKFGHILRVETVINRPKEFSVFRTRKHRDGTTSQGYFPMNKDVGSLIQTFYLAATDMGLGGCAIGSTNIDLFAKMTELEFHVESPVGQFALGRGRTPEIQD